jgi:hypothetical protein
MIIDIDVSELGKRRDAITQATKNLKAANQHFSDHLIKRYAKATELRRRAADSNRALAEYCTEVLALLELLEAGARDG